MLHDAVEGGVVVEKSRHLDMGLGRLLVKELVCGNLGL